MDFNALQHKLFSLDPSDPADDLKKLQDQAGGSAPEPKLENLAVVNESVDVPEGSLQLDKNYSVNDFAKLAGVTETQKTGSEGQAKGKDPMPKMSKPSKTGEQDHPLKDKLVGEAEEDRISALERRIDALEALLNEKAVSKKQQQFFGIVRAMQKGEMPKDGEAGDVAGDMKKSDVKKMASTKHKGLPTRVKSDIDTSNIKDRLYDALNKKMGIK
tara:strand:- start:1638 stop:2282 length:645 start_codon:yes stop_codon:yes gene_type:complete